MVFISAISWILVCSHNAVKASLLQDASPSNSTRALTLSERIRNGELITICRPEPGGEAPEVKPVPELSSMSYSTGSTASSNQHHSTGLTASSHHHHSTGSTASSHHHHSTGSTASSNQHYSTGSTASSNQHHSTDLTASSHHHHSTGSTASIHHHHSTVSSGTHHGKKHSGHHHHWVSFDHGYHNKYSKGASGYSHWHIHKNPKGHHGKSSGKSSKSKGSKGSPKGTDGKAKGSKGSPKGKGGKSKGSKGSPKRTDGKAKGSKGSPKGKGGKSKGLKESPKGKGGKSKGSKGSPNEKGGKSKGSKGSPKGKGRKSKGSKGSPKGKGGKYKGSKGNPKGKKGKSKGSKGNPNGKGGKSKGSKGKGNGHYWFHDHDDNSYKDDDVSTHHNEETPLHYHHGHKSVAGSHGKHQKSMVDSVTNTNFHHHHWTSLDHDHHSKHSKESTWKPHWHIHKNPEGHSGKKSIGHYWLHSRDHKSFHDYASAHDTKENSLSYPYSSEVIIGTHKKSEETSTIGATSVVSGVGKGSKLSYVYGSKNGKVNEKGGKVTDTKETNISANKSSEKRSSLSYNYSNKSFTDTNNKHQKPEVIGETTVKDVVSIAKGSSLSYNYGKSKGVKKPEVIGVTNVKDVATIAKGSSLSYNYGKNKGDERPEVIGETNVKDVATIAKGSLLSYNYGKSKGDEKEIKETNNKEKPVSVNESPCEGGSLSFNYGYKSVATTHNKYHKSVVIGVTTKNDVISIAKGSSLSYNYGKSQGEEKETKETNNKEKLASSNESAGKGGSLSYNYERRREKGTKKIIHLSVNNNYIKPRSNDGSFFKVFVPGSAGLHYNKRFLADTASSGEYCSGNSLPSEIMCKNHAETTDFEIYFDYEVEVTSKSPTSYDLARIEASMLSSAAPTISCSDDCGCIISGVSSSSSPVIKGDCKGYVGSYSCVEVRDAMTIHLVHLDGKYVDMGDIDNAAGKVTSSVKADAETGTYNHGSIIKVKVLGSSTDDTYTFSNEVQSVPINIPRSSTQGETSTVEAKSSAGFIVGLVLLCMGVFAALFFAMLKKKTKTEERELDDLAQAYYDGDDHFSKFGPWDVLSLSTDGKTLTSSVIDPSLNPAETSKNVHVCSSAMCTECSTRKNRSQRVQFIPCVDEKISEGKYDDEEKSF